MELRSWNFGLITLPDSMPIWICARCCNLKRCQPLSPTGPPTTVRDRNLLPRNEVVFRYYLQQSWHWPFKRMADPIGKVENTMARRKLVKQPWVWQSSLVLNLWMSSLRCFCSTVSVPSSPADGSQENGLVTILLNCWSPSQVARDFISKQRPISKTKIVVSNHNWKFTPSAEEIGNLVAQIQSTGADIVKFATTANDITDVARVLQVLSRSAVSRTLVPLLLIRLLRSAWASLLSVCDNFKQITSILWRKWFPRFLGLRTVHHLTLQSALIWLRFECAWKHFVIASPRPVDEGNAILLLVNVTVLWSSLSSLTSSTDVLIGSNNRLGHGCERGYQ